jgi:hypothetical protein
MPTSSQHCSFLSSNMTPLAAMLLSLAALLVISNWVDVDWRRNLGRCSRLGVEPGGSFRSQKFKLELSNFRSAQELKLPKATLTHLTPLNRACSPYAPLERSLSLIFVLSERRCRMPGTCERQLG